eukprot:TRINITY_DN21190_c0_g1_i1.p1 TRINITY_DN21190_c0_g1~~TRINITY_DN21190_c0_g1_i1.p1  ORF type:complete len:410 (+),score=86.55 TRINITY_DN21190_c0_g1_i1:68-1231(+)
MKVFTANGTTIPPESLTRAKAIYRSLRAHVFKTRDTLYKDTPLEDAFKRAWHATQPVLQPGDEEALSWHFFWEIVQDQIAQLEDLSTLEFDASLAYEGHDYIFKDGMGSLVKALAKGLNIVTNCTVTEIANSGSTMTAVCSNKSFTADYMVVALPLGVMQEGSVRFTPHLPTWKRRAIHRLGCSAALKMALKFDKVFWDNDVQFIGKLGDKNRTVFGKGNHIEFINMNYFKPGCNVLILEVDVQYATVMGMEYNSTQRLADVMHALRQMYPDAADPVGVKTANFVKDPLVGCGFSYWPPFVSGDDNLEASLPINSNRMHFIGEYTTPHHYGNMHGAIAEGERVAATIKRTTYLDAATSLAASLTQSHSRPHRKRFAPMWCPAPCQVN